MPIITENHFDILSDRWGDIDNENEIGNIRDCARIAFAMFEEMSFIAKDKRNDKLVLLIEQEFEEINLESLEAHAEELRKEFDIEVQITQHEGNYDNRVCVHAVVTPDKCDSILTAKIGKAMLDYAY